MNSDEETVALLPTKATQHPTNPEAFQTPSTSDARARARVRLCFVALALLSATLISTWGRIPFLNPTLPRHRHPMRPLRLGTWNLRYDGQSRQPVPIPPDGDGRGEGQASGEMPWSERRSKVADAVQWEDLDVVGFQEALTNQVEDLAVLLGPRFSWIGVGRDDGKQAGEYVPIFFRTDRLRLIAADTRHFWLSETPDIPGSVSWDAGQTRMVTLVHFAILGQPHAANSDVWVLNTHFDDRGVQSRTEASKVILREVNTLLEEAGSRGMRGRPVVLLGDLNSPSDEEGYRTITGHSYSSLALQVKPRDAQTTFLDMRHELALAHHSADAHSSSTSPNPPLLHAPFGAIEGTFTGFNPIPVNSIIDFILFLDNGVVGASGWKVSRFGVLPNQFDDGRGRMYISDHRLVVAQLDAP